MDEHNEKDTAEQLTPEQQELLAKFAAKRAARMAVAAGQPPAQAELAARLREMDAEFDSTPERDQPLVQENHELKRYVLILEDTVRKFMTGELAPTDAG